MKIQENLKFKIRKLKEIRDIMDKLLWAITNFIHRLSDCYDIINTQSFYNDIKKNYMNKIREITNKTNILINDFLDIGFEFEPHNSFSYDTKNSLNLTYLSISFPLSSLSCKFSSNSYFYPELSKYANEFTQKFALENEITIMCFKCKKKEPIYLCKTCNILFCENCIKEQYQISDKNHSIINFKDQKEKEKILFLNSISIIFKNILNKCDYLLKKDITTIKTKDINNSNIDFIKKIINLPYIKFISLEEEKNFLTDIEEKYSYLNQNDNYQNSFHISKIENYLTDIVKNILIEEPNILKDYNLQIDEDCDEDDFSDIINE